MYIDLVSSPCYYFATVEALTAELIGLHQHASTAAFSMGTHDLPLPVGRGDVVQGRSANSIRKNAARHSTPESLYW
jgi:hypothetical protein